MSGYGKALVAANDPTSDLLQFIALEVRGRAFALPIGSVVEFRTWIEPTPLPNAPFHVLGIVNIRGEIVPVFDVGALLGYGRTQPSPWHVIILAVTSREQVVGLLVDDVSDIIHCSEESVTDLPQSETPGDSPVVQSVVDAGDSVTGVIDIDCLCDAERVIGGETLLLPSPDGHR